MGVIMFIARPAQLTGLLSEVNVFTDSHPLNCSDLMKLIESSEEMGFDELIFFKMLSVKSMMGEMKVVSLRTS